MEKDIIVTLHKNFEEAAHTQGGVTHWSARDIQRLLEYTKWESFEAVIEKAIISCETSGQPAQNHFLDARKMVDIGSGSIREIKDYMLTRYACYLIAQNGDPHISATTRRHSCPN